MNSKSLIWIGMVVGSAIGGYIPLLWGGSLLSMSSIFLTAIGGLAGIYLGFRIANY